MMRAVLAAVLATAVILPATVATAGPIEDRKAIMKGNGRDTKMGGDMLKGVAPFDAATANKILANYAAAAKAFRVYYAKVKNSGSAADYMMDHSTIIYLMGPDGRFAKHMTYTTDAAKLAEELKKSVTASP